LTPPQIESLLIIAGMLALFVSDRLRYDLVAALALSAAALTGVVPAAKAFSGFSSSVVVIVASVLVISRAVAISGVLEVWTRRVLRMLNSTTLQVGALTSAVTFTSAVVKNVGAIGIFMPVAIQAAERRDRPVSRYLMPLAFGSLSGGTITEIGTSPNILISQVRQQVSGHPFGMFSFTSIGLPLSLAAVVFLSLGWRLLPANRRGQPAGGGHFAIEDYTSEAVVPATSDMVGKTVGALEELSEGDVTVAAIIRERSHRYVPRGHWRLCENDTLLLQGDPAALHLLISQTGLELLDARDAAKLPLRSKDDDLEAAEAVILPDALLVGRTAAELELRRTYEVNVLAISRAGSRDTVHLRHKRFEAGDIIIVQGRTTQLADAIGRLGCVPLAERDLPIGHVRSRYLPLIILGAAVLAVGFRAVPVEVGFFAAATLIVLLRLITMRQAYDAIDWPLVVMLGCLIPVGESLKTTGAANLISDGLTMLSGHLSGPLAVGLVLVISMLVTPLMHHAAAVLVMGPVAAAVAKHLGYGPDAFLMAVAFGAACDFLTPIGHQNSTMVMRPAGYLFGDYWRLGLPLSIMVAVFGTWLITLSWPLH